MSENDHLLISNRSHAYYKMGNYHAALADAESTIALRPDWGKGYFRKGMALKALGNKCSKICFNVPLFDLIRNSPILFAFQPYFQVNISSLLCLLSFTIQLSLHYVTKEFLDEVLSYLYTST